jgi:hypothetical protein
MGSDGSDSDGDDKQADLDAELNKKVATVMAPLMKKMRKQTKRIEELEEKVAQQAKTAEVREPKQDKLMEDLRKAVEEGLDRCRRDIGERVLHADHARVEVAVTSGLQTAQRTADDVRSRLAQIELTHGALQTRVEEVESHCRRGLDGCEERLAALRTTLNDETARGDARRSELQLHIAEVSAKLHAELVENRRETDEQLHKLMSSVSSTAKRSEVLERFAALEEAEGSSRARAERQQSLLASLEERTGQAEAGLRTKASQAEVLAQQEELSRKLGLTASAAGLAEYTRQLDALETQWERRHLAVEHAAAAGLRETQQTAANIQVHGAALYSPPPTLSYRVHLLCLIRVCSFRVPRGLSQELGNRLSDFALVGDLEEFKQQLSVISQLANKDALESVVKVATAAASQEALEALKVEHARTATGLQALIDGTNARFELAADAETQRKVDRQITELRRQLDGKLSTSQVEKMLEHKADASQLDRLATSGMGNSMDFSDLAARLEAAEKLLGSTQREANEAVERAASSASSLSQLQNATDKHWQITRTTREEQQQLVKAVRALLLDAELRVNSESAGGDSALTRVGDFMNEYGRHGWSSPSARHAHAGAGGGSAAMPPLPRVAVAASNANSCCASPTKRSSAPSSGLVPTPPLTDGGAADMLTRRRRLLAGFSVGGPGGDAVTLPEGLALPGGAIGGMSTRTRTRIGAGEAIMLSP